MNRRLWLGMLPMLLAFAALNAYVGWHGDLFLSSVWPSFPRVVYWILFFLVAFSYVFGRLLMKLPYAGRLLKVVGSYYFAVFEWSVILLLAADLAALIVYACGGMTASFVPAAGWTVLALLAALVAWGSYNAWSPVVRSYEIKVDKKTELTEPLKITVVSDIHLGNTVGNRHLDRLVPLVNGWEPDLILLAGDVIDDSIEPFVRNGMANRLGRLQARQGIFAVLGNHEYYGGHIEEYVERMRAIGIPVLRDETAIVAGGVQIAGRKDKTAEAMDPAGRKPIRDLVASFDPERPIVVMDHQPYQYDLAADAGVDILVSGHTHRGQFAPNHWVTARLFELDWGYLRKRQMHAFVSSGFGTWGPPIRLASRSEIIQITVRFKGESD
ncbi:metallophosphoesterase [Cohnella thermotolerans]|uniref:metallophosphoesterase n=1 Tax=Cohnella thermotolerans TaxID=329858 RepID=UPI00040C2199|nr:metallophosphoesterase [Cohnella thermotolerans]